MSKTVAVWSSDPKFGDPYEGVFYMKPPYGPDALRDEWQERGRQWGKMKHAAGLNMTTKPRLVGPIKFEDNRRHDLSETRREDDEWVLVAWFKRDMPLILSTEEVERRRVLAERYGHSPRLPHRGDLQPAGVQSTIADEMAEYRDPHGRDEAGNTASDRRLLGIEEHADAV